VKGCHSNSTGTNQKVFPGLFASGDIPVEIETDCDLRIKEMNKVAVNKNIFLIAFIQ
jgi:hypothetical protein